MPSLTFVSQAHSLGEIVQAGKNACLSFRFQIWTESVTLALVSKKKRARKERRLRERHLAEIRESQERLARRALRNAQVAGEGESVLIRNPEAIGMRKMSEVLAEFAEPYLEHAHSFEDQKKTLTLAVLAWNLSLMGPVSGWLEFRKLMKMMASPEDPHIEKDLQAVIKQMVNRKKEKFVEIKRLIIDFQYIQTSRGPHLNVVSTVLQGSDTDRQAINQLDEKFDSADAIMSEKLLKQTSS